jgi:hypothetical protein
VISAPRRRFALRIALIALVGLAWARPGRALDLELEVPRLESGTLWVDIAMGEVFSPRVENSLARGMPATLQFHAELWRRRRGWFDRLVHSFDASVKIRYEVWSKSYRIEQKGRPTMSAPTLDSVAVILSRPLGIPVAPASLLESGPRFYVVMAVTLKPLTVEDIEEGEGWLSGEVQTKRGAGIGVITAVPRALFDAVRNFTGFGDQKARAISEEFELEEL